MPIIVMKGQDGADILVEVADETAVPVRGRVGKRGGETIVEKAQEYSRSFSSIGQYIMTICAEIYDKYQSTAQRVKPDQMEIQFGIKLSGEGGVPFLSKGAAEGSIQVTAKWASTRSDNVTPPDSHK